MIGGSLVIVYINYLIPNSNVRQYIITIRYNLKFAVCQVVPNTAHPQP